MQQTCSQPSVGNVMLTFPFIQEGVTIMNVAYSELLKNSLEACHPKQKTLCQCVLRKTKTFRGTIKINVCHINPDCEAKVKERSGTTMDSNNFLLNFFVEDRLCRMNFY